jgi:hypothetical protein
MDVCTREDPPKVGTDEQFAACWWVQREKGTIEGVAGESRATITASA